MKKLLLLIMSVITLTLNAQVYTEYLDTASDGQDLELYNGWYPSFKASEVTGLSPIIVDAPLTYTDYAGSGVGKAVAISDTLSTKRISTKVITDGVDSVFLAENDIIYYSMLFRPTEISTDSNLYDIFDYEASSTSNFSRGRVFVNTFLGSDIQFGVSMNSSGDVDTCARIESGMDATYLLVVAYEQYSGGDSARLYINPDPTKTAAEQVNVLTNIDSKSSYSLGTLMKMNIRQNAVTATMSGIRVGKDWSEVVAGVKVTGVTLDQDTIYLGLGSGVPGNLVATVTPSYAPIQTVTWGSTDDLVATVDASGVVTAVAVGTAKIYVTTDDQGLTDTCVVNVTPPIDVISVSLNKTTSSIATFLTDTLEATILPVDASNTNVTWASTDDLVATVDASGVVTAVAEGTAKISVTTDDQGKSDTCTVTVADVDVTGITINAADFGLVVTKTKDLSATIAPENATYKTVTWSSSAPAVATVDASSGLVTAVSEGTATITVTSNDDATKTASVVVTVTEAKVVPTIIEYFEDAVIGEDLEDYNGWYVSPKSGDALGVSPVFGQGDAMYYYGYAGSEQGKVVEIDSTNGYTDATKRISTKIAGNVAGDTLYMDNDTAGVYYAAFLFKPKEHSYSSWRDFFGWEASSTSNSSRGRVFMNLISGNTIQFGVSKNVPNMSSVPPLDTATRIANGLDKTYLMVLKYTVSAGASNDTIRLYINPDPTLPEDTVGQVLPLASKDIATDYPADAPIRVNIRQRGHNGEIGGIRIGTNWKYVLQGDPEPESGVSSTPAGVNDLKIYPNPSNGTFTIANQAGADVSIYDVTGKVVYQRSNIENNEVVATQLTKGMYFVSVVSANTQKISKIIVK
jgi:uncharacterized protein YjdB